MDTNCCEDDRMKLWQKIFIPSMILTMLGIFVIATGFVVRSHTLQVESKKDEVLFKASEVIKELQQSVDTLFFSSYQMQTLSETLELKYSDDAMKVVISVIEDTNNVKKQTGFVWEETDGRLSLVTIEVVAGNVCEVSVSRNIQPLLKQFREDIGAVQIYGIVVALGISIALLILALVLTKPIEELKYATEEIAAGEYSHRIIYKGKDELSELAQYMNDMAAHIEKDTAYITGIADSRRTFIANMTHELKTPLTSILGFADVLRMKSDISEEEKKEYAEIIFTEASRLRTLSSRLMELLTIEETQIYMSSVMVNELIEQEMKMYEPICRDAEIHLVLDLEPVMIKADETLLATLIVNLIDNARKASKPGQKILVSCKHKSEQVMIQVKDEGIGIPSEQLAYVTEAFYMVDKARTRKEGGAGIGLALCKAIATAHHGTLEMESEPEKGTTVSIFIPRYKEAEVG